MSYSGIEVRQFASFLEVSQLDNFVSNNPVNQENYRNLVGDYWDENEVKCCFQKKNGNLCNTDHKFGFVVEVKDGTLTVIGNCCAKDKFDVDARIRIDRKKYLNEKERIKRIESVRQLLAKREERLERLQFIRSLFAEIGDVKHDIQSEIGPQTYSRLIGIAKSGRGTVNVVGVRVREFEKEDGSLGQEVDKSEIGIGTIRGARIFNSGLVESLKIKIARIEQTYDRIKDIPQDITKREVDDISATLNEFDTVQAEAERLSRAKSAFEDNSPLLICFLASDKAERYRAARWALARMGEGGGREKAKQWLSEQEKQIAKEISANRVEIPG